MTKEELVKLREAANKSMPASSPAAGEYLADRLAFIESRRIPLPFIYPIPILLSPDPRSMIARCKGRVIASPIMLWEVVFWLFEREEDYENFKLLQEMGKGPVT